MTIDIAAPQTVGATNGPGAPAQLPQDRLPDALEVSEAEARLEALCEPYAGLLRNEVLRVAHVAAFARDLAERRIALEVERDAAVSNLDADVAVDLALQLAALRSLEDAPMPSTEIAPNVAAMVRARATQDLSQIGADIHSRREVLDLAAEITAHRALVGQRAKVGPAYVAEIDKVDPPTVTRADAEARTAEAAFAKKRDALAAELDVALGAVNTTDPLSIASAYTALRARADAIVAEARRLDEQVAAANTARRDAGIAWSVPAALEAVVR